MIGAHPAGEWKLDLATGIATVHKTIRDLFANERIIDVVLLVSSMGTTPPWPA